MMPKANGTLIKSMGVILVMSSTIAAFIWNFSTLATETKLKNEHQDIQIAQVQAEVKDKGDKTDKRIDKLLGVVEKNTETQHQIQLQQKEIQGTQKSLQRDVNRLIKKIDDK